MPSRRWPLSILLVAVYVLVFTVQTWMTRTYFTLPQPGGNDFYPRWAGGCLWLRQGADPYAASTTRAIQEGIYRRPALPEEDQAAYAYPIYAVVFTWPLCLTQDFSVARALWMTALSHMLVGGALLARTLSGWRPAWRLWPWVLAWTILVYPNARALVLGQMSVVVFLLVLGALAAIRVGRDGVAGLLLALSTVKPQVVLLIVPFLLIWSAYQRRWAVVIGFAVSLTALVGLPLLAHPAWPAEFMRQLNAYTSYTELGSVTWIIASHYLGLPPIVEWAITFALLGWLAWEWYRSRHLAFGQMLWTASLTLVITHFVAPRTATTHFGLLILPLFMVFALHSRSYPDRASFAASLVLVVLLIGTWWLFLATVQGRQESAITYLPIPLALAGYLPWIRRPWIKAAEGLG
jgi:Glycosyltransferase family 87